MGIRVHVALGYGLDDIQENDPRIDLAIFQERLRALTSVGAFSEWVTSQQERLEELAALEFADRHSAPGDIKRALKDTHRSLYQYIHQYTEYGLPNVLLFQGLGYEDWYRTDNVIDYYEYGRLSGDGSPKCDRLWSGIYPYNTRMIRARSATPEIDDEVQCHCYRPGLMDIRQYSELCGYWDPSIPPTAEGALLKHLKEDWRANIPVCVLPLLLWFEPAFCGVERITPYIRPMRYVWWA